MKDASFGKKHRLACGLNTGMWSSKQDKGIDLSRKVMKGRYWRLLKQRRSRSGVSIKTRHLTVDWTWKTLEDIQRLTSQSCFARRFVGARPSPFAGSPMLELYDDLGNESRGRIMFEFLVLIYTFTRTQTGARHVKLQNIRKEASADLGIHAEESSFLKREHERTSSTNSAISKHRTFMWQGKRTSSDKLLN